MNDFVFLHGLALANYRGIGKDINLVGPFQRFNFMIGPNNAGKSCLLRFLANHLNPLVFNHSKSHSNTSTSLDQLDIHIGATTNDVRMGVGVPKSLILDKILSQNYQLNYQNYKDFIEKLFSRLGASHYP